jgi:hypothetical protein
MNGVERDPAMTERDEREASLEAAGLVEPLVPPESESEAVAQATAAASEIKMRGSETAESIAARRGITVDAECRSDLAAISVDADEAVADLASRLAASVAESREGEGRRAGKERFFGALAELREQRERRGEHEGNAKTAIVGDGEAIEGQHISLIQTSEGIKCQFKLTAEHFKKVEALVKALDYQNDAISMPLASGKRATLCRARAVDFGLARVKIFRPRTPVVRHVLDMVQTGQFSCRDAGTGMISIEMPASVDGRELDDETLFREISDALEGLLDVPAAMEPPSEEDDRRYKEHRYVWHNMIDRDSVDESELRERAENLTREEVFPGHFSLVDRGRSREYQAVAPHVLTHEIAGTANQEACRKRLLDILRSDGIMSRIERYQRGLGSQSVIDPDLRTGGGDSAFARMVTKGDRRTKEHSNAYKILIDPEQLDRTDVYCYNCDNFGATGDTMMSRFRRTPEDLLRTGLKRDNWQNELMFRAGIPRSSFLGVSCRRESDRQYLVDFLREEGVDEINGIPIEEFILLHETKEEMVDQAAANKAARVGSEEADAPS